MNQCYCGLDCGVLVVDADSEGTETYTFNGGTCLKVPGTCSGYDETVSISKAHAPKVVKTGAILTYTALLKNSQKVGDITDVGVQVQLPAGVTYLSSKVSGYKPSLDSPEMDMDTGILTWPVTPLVGKKGLGHRFSVRVRVNSDVADDTELVFSAAFFEAGTDPLCTYYGADRTVCMLIRG